MSVPRFSFLLVRILSNRACVVVWSTEILYCMYSNLVSVLLHRSAVLGDICGKGFKNHTSFKRGTVLHMHLHEVNSLFWKGHLLVIWRYWTVCFIVFDILLASCAPCTLTVSLWLCILFYRISLNATIQPCALICRRFAMLLAVNRKTDTSNPSL